MYGSNKKRHARVTLTLRHFVDVTTDQRVRFKRRALAVPNASSTI